MYLHVYRWGSTRFRFGKVRVTWGNKARYWLEWAGGGCMPIPQFHWPWGHSVLPDELADMVVAENGKNKTEAIALLQLYFTVGCTNKIRPLNWKISSEKRNETTFCGTREWERKKNDQHTVSSVSLNADITSRIQAKSRTNLFKFGCCKISPSGKGGWQCGWKAGDD